MRSTPNLEGALTDTLLSAPSAQEQTVPAVSKGSGIDWPASRRKEPVRLVRAARTPGVYKVVRVCAGLGAMPGRAVEEAPDGLHELCGRVVQQQRRRNFDDNATIDFE